MSQSKTLNMVKTDLDDIDKGGSVGDQHVGLDLLHILGTAGQKPGQER